MKAIGTFTIVLLMAALPALAQRTNLVPAWNLFSPQQDIEMGRMLADELERTYAPVADNNTNTYIDALGKQLIQRAPGNRYPYQFKVVRDSNVELWALPGGFLYVSTGLVESAQNEPQLAGALAHGIAHVALRHGTTEVSQALGRGSNSNRNRVSVNDAMSQLNIRFEPGALPIRFTPEDERQADIMAAQIMFDASFDPRQVTDFFNTVINDRSNRTRDFISDHPVSNVAATVNAELRKLGALPRNVRGDSPDFHSIKDRLVAENRNSPPPVYERDRAYSNRDRAYSNRPDQPSGRMVSYRGRDLEFRYPDNWRVSENNDTITVGPNDAYVSGSLAYGMTIGTFDPRNERSFGRNSFSAPGTRADNTTLANATDQLIDHLRQSNPNMRVIRDTARTRVDGLQAMEIEISNDSPLGGQETDWLVTVLRPNGLLEYFVGVAPEREFNQYRPIFDRIVGSVRFLD